MPLVYIAGFDPIPESSPKSLEVDSGALQFSSRSTDFPKREKGSPHPFSRTPPPVSYPIYPSVTHSQIETPTHHPPPPPLPPPAHQPPTWLHAPSKPPWSHPLALTRGRQS